MQNPDYNRMNPKVHPCCPVCGTTAIHPLRGFKKHELMKCSSCGFVFMRNIPSPQELEEHYAVYAYADEKELPEATRISIENVLNQFETFRKTNHMLDVGCGEGWILELARSRGWQVYGTEFSPRAVAICEKKGIKMYAGVLNPAQFQGIEFDVIISTETIEHIINPAEEINHFYQLLRPGGLLYLTTPNFNSYLRYLFRDNYAVISYPEHLSFFTRKSLHRLLTGSGFRRHKLLTTGISISLFEQSKTEGTIAQEKSKKKEDRFRNRVARSALLRRAKDIVNSILTFLGAGVKLKAFYIRK
jgi:SAM-dependent methyltransferase